jgi:hypothetical protein
MWWNLKNFRPEPLPNLPAGWQVEILKMKIRTKSYIEKLLPELKPNSEPMLIGIASAPILQNPLLSACASTLSIFVSIIFILCKVFYLAKVKAK